MSRRTGQNGTIEVRNGAYRGRWLEDVPGQVERVKRSVVLGFVKEMTQSEAKRKLREIITASGINSPRYRIPSADCFAKRVEWWEQNYLVRQKPATRKQFSYHVRKYLLPKWGKAPVDGITADQVNEWIGAPELAHLSRVSIKLVVDTLWSGNLLNRVLHPILRRLGIPQGGMHGFRHGRVSFLVEHGAPVEVIKAWIGHGSDAMIRRYTHLRPQYRSRVLASMPAVFAPLPPDFHRGKVVQIA